MKLSSTPIKSTVEAGLYPAVCFGLIDIGTQENNYNDKISWQRKGILKFELLDETDEEGKRLVLSQIYNMSMSEMSKFRKHLKAWRGKDFSSEELLEFDPKKVLGTNVILNVVIHDKTGRAIIDGMAKYKDTPMQAVRDEEYFSFDEFDSEFLPDFISDGIAGIIYKSKEWKNLEGCGITEKVSNKEYLDNKDIPF